MIVDGESTPCDVPFGEKKNQSPVLNSNRAFESGAGSLVFAGDQTTFALFDEFWAQTEILTDREDHLRRKQKDNKGSGKQPCSETQKASKAMRGVRGWVCRAAQTTIF